MAEQDLRNTSFYKALLQIAKEQGVVTLLDIVSEMKKRKRMMRRMRRTSMSGKAPMMTLRPLRNVLSISHHSLKAHLSIKAISRPALMQARMIR